MLKKEILTGSYLRLYRNCSRVTGQNISRSSTLTFFLSNLCFMCYDNQRTTDLILKNENSGEFSLKKKELIFIIGIVIFALILWGGMYFVRRGHYGSVRITVNGEVYGTYSLAKDQVIRINDTNVNYPLLQAEDDDTYMNTDAEGNYSLSGSIFLHCANSPDFSDFNNLIYGHHMEKHKMFGDVGLFTEKKYFDEHPYGNLFFDGKDHGIEFYALLQADAYNERLFSVCPETSEAKQEYLQEILDNALYKRNLNVTEEDHLVLLITCTSEMTNGRNILVGRLTEQVYPEKEKPKNVGTGIDQIRKLVISVPVLFWLILLLLILLILDQILRKKGKKNDEHP